QARSADRGQGVSRPRQVRDLILACARSGAERLGRDSQDGVKGMDRDPFDFDANPPAAGDDVERPEGGEDDPALMGPVLEALKTVRDPEIPMHLVELGLIYELMVKKEGIVYVEMPLTPPACPVAASMPGEVEAAIRGVPGVTDVRVKLVWTPPWGPERMSEEARLELGML